MDLHCNKAVDKIIQQLKSTESRSLNLAFLDPEGLELHWETIAKLASIRRMDLIINYPQAGLSRLTANMFEEPGDTLVDKFFGSHEWRLIYSSNRRSRSRRTHRELLDLIKRQLQNLGYQEVVLNNEISGEEPLIHSTTNRAPLYRLIFASKHAMGKEFWHKVTQRDVYGQRRLFDSL